MSLLNPEDFDDYEPERVSHAGGGGHSHHPSKSHEAASKEQIVARELADREEAENAITGHLAVLWKDLPETERTKRIARYAEWMETSSREPVFVLNRNEVKVETKTSSGPGGQNVNKVATAARAKHIQTGLRVDVQTARKQYDNKEEAYRALEQKITEHIGVWKRTSPEFRQKLRETKVE